MSDMLPDDLFIDVGADNGPDDFGIDPSVDAAGADLTAPGVDAAGEGVGTEFVVEEEVWFEETVVMPGDDPAAEADGLSLPDPFVIEAGVGLTAAILGAGGIPRRRRGSKTPKSPPSAGR